MWDQCRQHSRAMQKWSPVDLLVLKAFASVNEPLSIVKCITEEYSTSFAVSCFGKPSWMHADPRTGKQQDPQISDNDMNRYLVYRAASVHSAERRRCNKALEAIELLPPETASTPRCFLLHYHGMTLSRSSLRCTYDFSTEMTLSRSIDQLIAVLSNASSKERLFCWRSLTLGDRSQFRSITYRLSI